MNDFGLDLAVIGNGRSAALLDPTARIVWWCYSRFDGDRRYHRRHTTSIPKAPGSGAIGTTVIAGCATPISSSRRSTATVPPRPWRISSPSSSGSLRHLGSTAAVRLLERLGVKAAQLAFEPDAGTWEYRGRSRVHTHSTAMCWAGCNRLGAIAAHLGMDERAAHWSSIATAMQARLLDQAWNEKRGAFAAAIGLDDLDASVLLLPEIGLLETRDPRSCTL
jgi:hypothetical protein